MILGKQPRFNIDPESFFGKGCVCVRACSRSTCVTRAQINNDNGKNNHLKMINDNLAIKSRFIYAPFPMLVYQRG